MSTMSAISVGVDATTCQLESMRVTTSTLTVHTAAVPAAMVITYLAALATSVGPAHTPRLGQLTAVRYRLATITLTTATMCTTLAQLARSLQPGRPTATLSLPDTTTPTRAPLLAFPAARVRILLEELRHVVVFQQDTTSQTLRRVLTTDAGRVLIPQGVQLHARLCLQAITTPTPIATRTMAVWLAHILLAGPQVALASHLASTTLIITPRHAVLTFVDLARIPLLEPHPALQPLLATTHPDLALAHIRHVIPGRTPPEEPRNAPACLQVIITPTTTGIHTTAVVLVHTRPVVPRLAPPVELAAGPLR